MLSYLKQINYLILTICVCIMLYLTNYERNSCFRWVVLIPMIYVIYHLFFQLRIMKYIEFSNLKNKINIKKNMKANLFVTLGCFILIFSLSFFQEEEWFKYVIIFPLVYIVYAFIIGMISWANNTIERYKENRNNEKNN